MLAIEQDDLAARRAVRSPSARRRACSLMRFQSSAYRLLAAGDLVKDLPELMPLPDRGTVAADFSAPPSSSDVARVDDLTLEPRRIAYRPPATDHLDRCACKKQDRRPGEASSRAATAPGVQRVSGGQLEN
jgi:hypothetical protein